MPDQFPVHIDPKYDTAQPKIPNCAMPIKESIKSDDLIFSADSGHEQRRQKSAPKRAFDLSWPVLTKYQYFTLRDFYMAHTTSKSFIWIHPVEKTQILVRFSNDTFGAENFGFGPTGPLYKLQIQLTQVWS